MSLHVTTVDVVGVSNTVSLGTFLLECVRCSCSHLLLTFSCWYFACLYEFM